MPAIPICLLVVLLLAGPAVAEEQPAHQENPWWKYGVSTPQPLYPQNELLRGTEGRVLVEFGVSRYGRVERVKLLESSPGRLFVKTTADTLRNWKFRPAEEWATPPGSQRYKFEFIFDTYPCSDLGNPAPALGHAVMRICASLNPADIEARRREFEKMQAKPASSRPDTPP